MPLSAKRWKVITPSEFGWEREALEFIRERLPEQEPYHVWANFEFISDNGTISEVDLLALTPAGLFLVEIKSRPGVISGDGLTWTWKHDGKIYVADNPILLANRKAKKLAALLKRQKACKNIRFPYLTPLIFCSNPENQNQLQGSARFGVCLRDKEASQTRPTREGIITALTQGVYEGASEHPPFFIDRATAKAIVLAMEQAGIQQSQRSRRVADYLLEKILYESPMGTYQDWEATHVAIKTSSRRVRIYNIARTATEAERESIRRAAKREYQLLEALNHPSILQVESFTEHEFGPALIFRHDKQSIRLDHFLTQQAGRINVDIRLNLLRQIAEAVKYAHEKRIIHRALSPQNILVTDVEADFPKVKIFNWQIGFRSGSTTSTKDSSGLGATLHPEHLIEDSAMVYMAPESISETENLREHLDIFSLGAIAFYLFSGQPPATNAVDLMQKVRDGKGLQISTLLDGAGTQLQELIQFSTYPDVMLRWETVSDFLAQLERVEDEITTPDPEPNMVINPREAKAGDILHGGFGVISRLGSGASAVAFLVEHQGKEVVLKLANSLEHNDRLREEAETVKKLRHTNIVEAYEVFEVGDFVGYTMQKATTQKPSSQDSVSTHTSVEGTLAHRIKVEGRLHIELLQRFGEDLLDAVRFLEQEGIYHRDIKPDNIGIKPIGSSGKLRLILFDFSLSRTSLDNIRAGTIPYLDPFLSLRKPPRWDLAAERFAVAMTLHEMATGTLPKWGDGLSSPEVLDCEVTLRPELFDPNLRDAMMAFFTKALRRDYRERFDNADEMLAVWRKIFESVDKPVSGAIIQEDFDQEAAINNATLTTQVLTLGLSTRAANALDRLNVISVKDLLIVPLHRVYRLTGVGSKTRNEVRRLINSLRLRFPEIEPQPSLAADTTTGSDLIEKEVTSVDLIAQQVVRFGTKGKAQKEREVLLTFLDWDAVGSERSIEWISQIESGRRLSVSRAYIGQVITKSRERWRRNSSITALRHLIADFIETNSGAMTAKDLSDAVLATRGSVEEEPLRSQYASIITRVAIETEQHSDKPRFIERRSSNTILIAANNRIADYIEKLGKKADQLAKLDPLSTPTAVLEALREITPPDDATFISDPNLVKLAVATSQIAAVSSKMEIYPRGMSASRALKLASGALFGARELTVNEIQQRVQGRYPEAGKLPAHPELERLLADAGLELKWNENANDGNGAYQYTNYDKESGLSSSTTHARSTTVLPSVKVELVYELSPELADAKLFESKLQRAYKEGAFLALSVSLIRLIDAEKELIRRFDLAAYSFDDLLLGAMREQARAANVDWQVVLKADAAPRDSADWRNLKILVNRSIPLVEAELEKSNRTILLTYPGLLARYEQLSLLERLRDKVTTPNSTLHGLWVLLPSNEQSTLPMLDGIPVPVISTGQWAHIPESWVYNEHRAENGNGNKTLEKENAL